MASRALPFSPIVRALARPLGTVWGGVAAARGMLYDREFLPSRRLPIPVLSVGNLTVGGTGKTPLVARLAARFAERGRRPAIVLRGYGGANARRRGAPVLIVSDGSAGGAHASWRDAGDEAVLLAHLLPRIPVLVSRNRTAAGSVAAERLSADLLLLDDGFQHRGLHRDADLVTLDARQPFGAGGFVPAGRLREAPRALRRAHAVVITRAERDVDWQAARAALESVVPGLPVFRARHRALGLWRVGRGDRLSPEAVRDVPVSAFAGLARPEALSESLAMLGARVVSFHGFADHHAFTAAELEAVSAAARAAGARFIVTTRKDAVRLDPAIKIPDLAILDIDIAIEDEAVLLARLEALCMPPSRTRAVAPPPG